jgi:hypothetical protein
MADGPAGLTLPPPYAELRLDPGADVLAEACARASELGAGALLHAERPGLLSLAVVLEPEQPLAEARLAFYAGAAALADALAVLCPPEHELLILWPDLLICNAGRIAGAALAWPEGTAEGEAPDWLVFAAELIGDRDELAEPGRRPDSTSLKEEDIGPPSALIESFASHLMLNLDTWAARGFGGVAPRYLGRLESRDGLRHRIDRAGDLLEGGDAGVAVRRALKPALAARAWRDPVRGGPRL